jgi:acyl carrier protein
MEDADSNSNLDQKVRALIVRTFELSDDDALSELRFGSVPGWDSIGHVRLVVELEEEFGMSIPTYLLPEILDVDSIVRETQKLMSEK